MTLTLMQEESFRKLVFSDPRTAATAAFFIDDAASRNELEEWICQDPTHSAIVYARDAKGGRWPALEERIAEIGDPDLAASYAILVMERPWPELESVIMTDDKAVYDYGRTFYRTQRWEFLETAIREGTAGNVVWYLKGRNPDNLPIDLVDWFVANAPTGILPDYIHNFCNSQTLRPHRDRIIERIAGDPHASFKYAFRDGNRFPAGEPAILTDAGTAVRYAVEVLGCRWPEAEGVIAESHYAPRYVEMVVRQSGRTENAVEPYGFRDIDE